MRLTYTTILLLLAIGALSTACGGGTTDASSATANVPLLVTRGDFRETIHLSGEIEAAEGVTITVPRLPNWQTTIKTIVADGTRVEQGAVIAELDSTPFSTGLEQKRDQYADNVQERTKQLSRSAADLEKLELDLEKARIELEKAKTKAAVPPEILPRREYEENQLALRRAEVTHEKARNDLESRRRAEKATLANLQIQIEKAGAEIGTAEAAISSMSLLAPSAGVVIVGENPETGRKFQQSDTVWVGMEIISIPNLDTLRVSAIVVDVDDGRVVPGQRVEVVPDAYPEIRLVGRIESVTTAANSLTPESLRRGFIATVAIDRDSTTDKLRPGFSVRATVVRSETKGALLVPRAALVATADGSKARLRNGALVPVKLGACNDHDCILLDGLELGDALSSVPSAKESS
ncbi:MAG: efflux RND transporter periplasmic adaptor subunit [Acidobacteria bacterium]|nr:efflux RND transporter periplasmic adaptor subunit [Acidobacteriota bacterium]